MASPKRFDDIFIHPLGTLLMAGIGAATALGTGGVTLAVFAGTIAAIGAVKSRHLDVAQKLADRYPHKLLPADHPVCRMTRRLAKEAGLASTPLVMIAPGAKIRASEAPYVGTAGTPSSSIIIVSPNVDRKMTASELEAVLAHEITHIRHSDTKMDMLQNSLMSMAGFSVTFCAAAAIMGFFGMVLPLAPAAGFVAVGGFVGSLALRAAISRARERRADRGSAELTKNPWALAAALGRIVELQLGKLRSLNREAPGPAQKAMIRIFRSHPKTKWRRQTLVEIGARMIEQDPGLAAVKRRTAAEAKAFELTQTPHALSQPRKKSPWDDRNDDPGLRGLTASPAPGFLSGKTLPFNEAAREQDNEPPAPAVKAAGRQGPHNFKIS